MEANDRRELIDYDEARVLWDFEPPNPSLIVSGVLPYEMKVVLEPLREVVAEPDYWPLEVVGYRGEVGIPRETPYSKQESLSTLPQGSKGIEVIGKSQRMNVDTVPDRAR
jgi:hypothetical protein